MTTEYYDVTTAPYETLATSASEWAARQDTGHPDADRVLQALARSVPETTNPLRLGPPWTSQGTIADVARRVRLRQATVDLHLAQLQRLCLARGADMGDGSTQWLLGLYAMQGDYRRWYRPPYPAIPTAVRAFVMERDGRTCQICAALDDLTLDHIIPQKFGGLSTPDNLRVLCRPCNSSKGAKLS